MPIQIETGDRVTPQAVGTAGSHPLWGRSFRPFFLGVGVYGFVVVAAWTAIWRGGLPAPAWLAPAWWHGHEMLFGLVAGAIAGFLLTAAPVWTGRPALCGRPLMALFGLWALGRLAMVAAGVLPAGLVAGIDLAFLPVVAGVLARTVWRTGQRQNYGVVVLVGLLALANAAVHAQALGLAAGAAPRALRSTVDLVVVLIVVIGGRITPGFTTNALIRLGVAARASSRPWLDRLAVAAVA
ncbi:MAG: NnrS family protein, partial [Candidatus Rokuibacteriota bacterium]